MDREFHMRRRVQFAETDMAGVMHFANYFRIMEEVEHEFWRSLGLSVQMEEGGRRIGWPRVRVGCEYLAPARFEDVLDVRLRVVEVGGTSVSFEVEFLRDGQRLACGQATAVCCAVGDGGTFRPRRVPATIRRRLEAFTRSP